MKRLDIALVEKGLAPTRTKAQQLIEAGDVEVLVWGEWKTIQQSSFNLESGSTGLIRLKGAPEILKYVSRGGLKLEGALKHLQLDVTGWRGLDIGISTGGFTDCLLQAGAAMVCGFDVGHNQLHNRLTNEPRVKAFEGVHIKDAGGFPPLKEWISGGVDLCVADLSFISLISVIPQISALLPDGTRFLGLVKPQFEVGAANLNKAGIVTDEGLFPEIEMRVRTALTQHGWKEIQFFPSTLKGQDGNQEFFAYAIKA